MLDSLPGWVREAAQLALLFVVAAIAYRVTVRFGDQQVYPSASSTDLATLEAYLSGEEVHIGVDLGIGSAHWTVYGCDLSDGYVRINADYTT